MEIGIGQNAKNLILLLEVNAENVETINLKLYVIYKNNHIMSRNLIFDNKYLLLKN
jgi:hypothetical protein